MVSRLMKDLIKGGHVVESGRDWLLPAALPDGW
jgi:hypothetical protein